MTFIHGYSQMSCPQKSLLSFLTPLTTLFKIPFPSSPQHSHYFLYSATLVFKTLAMPYLLCDYCCFVYGLFPPSRIWAPSRGPLVFHISLLSPTPRTSQVPNTEHTKINQEHPPCSGHP